MSEGLYSFLRELNPNTKNAIRALKLEIVISLPSDFQKFSKIESFQNIIIPKYGLTEYLDLKSSNRKSFY